MLSTRSYIPLDESTLYVKIKAFRAKLANVRYQETVAIVV